MPPVSEGSIVLSGTLYNEATVCVWGTFMDEATWPFRHPAICPDTFCKVGRCFLNIDEGVLSGILMF